MQGGKRVIETFPSSAALNRSFRAANHLVVHLERELALDPPLDRVPHHPERALPREPNVPAVHGLVDQLPVLLPHRACVPEEVREVDSESAVSRLEVETELLREGRDERRVLPVEAGLGPHRLRERVPADQVLVREARDDHPRDRVGEDLREHLLLPVEGRVVEGRPVPLLERD